MKKLISIAGLAVLLAGCTMGINQSTATINGKPFLVEKSTYTLPIPIYQWAGKPRFTDLENMEPEEQYLKTYLNKIRYKCAHKEENSFSSEKTYECMLQYIKK